MFQQQCFHGSPGPGLLDSGDIVIGCGWGDKRKDVAFVELTYYGSIAYTSYNFGMSSNGSSSPWPETLLREQQVSRVYVCGREAEPPVLSHVVNFPRLEIPLAGCYENQIESGGHATTVRLKPGDALFAPPNC